jgi:hypothetical protein
MARLLKKYFQVYKQAVGKFAYRLLDNRRQEGNYRTRRVNYSMGN